jgi:hypothetical protein
MQLRNADVLHVDIGRIPTGRIPIDAGTVCLPANGSKGSGGFARRSSGALGKQLML